MCKKCRKKKRKISGGGCNYKCGDEEQGFQARWIKNEKRNSTLKGGGLSKKQITALIAGSVAAAGIAAYGYNKYNQQEADVTIPSFTPFKTRESKQQTVENPGTVDLDMKYTSPYSALENFDADDHLASFENLDEIPYRDNLLIASSPEKALLDPLSVSPSPLQEVAIDNHVASPVQSPQLQPVVVESEQTLDNHAIGTMQTFQLQPLESDQFHDAHVEDTMQPSQLQPLDEQTDPSEIRMSDNHLASSENVGETPFPRLVDEEESVEGIPGKKVTQLKSPPPPNPPPRQGMHDPPMRREAAMRSVYFPPRKKEIEDLESQSSGQTDNKSALRFFKNLWQSRKQKND